MTELEISNAAVFATAKNKARFGHRDWIVWPNPEGLLQAAPKSVAVLKKALLACGTKKNLLACGTKKKWYVVAANSGNLHRGFWSMGILMIRNSRYGV